MFQEEERLIQRAKEGDPAAFVEIYERYYPFVYRYTFYRVEDVATAEDLTAEVFVRVVENIGRFTYRGRPLLAWLYTIARNVVTDHYRRAGQLPTVPLNGRLVADGDAPEKALEQTLTQERLAAAIARLTEEQRRVILLRFVEGLDGEAVARILGRSVGAVKALQHRALAALRRILEED